MSGRRYVYRGVADNGQTTTQTVEAPTRADAMRLAMQSGLAVLELKEEAQAAEPRRRKLTRDHSILLLRQLSVMIGAGVQLLDAIETLAASLPGTEASEKLRLTAQALRRGDRFGDALEASLPVYPSYVYGLVRAGEASGKLARVLEEAAQQLAFERRVERDVLNALTYPAFLVISGAGSVGFLLYFVVPRFATMLESSRSQPTGISRFVLETGVAFHDNAVSILSILAAALVLLIVLSRTPATRAALSQLAHATPGLRALLSARQRTAWSRVAALSLDAGVGILDAIALAAGALPEGRLKTAVMGAIPALRAGRGIDAAFSEAGAISQVDASLLRAGQRSGALAKMMHTIADRHEEDLRDSLKRLTVIVEPMAIATVALMVGGIVLALASALVGVYETIG
ncbi:MAG: type II secretion system F family protein [Terricaulis sp.]